METGKLTRVLNIGLSLGVRRRGGAAAFVGAYDDIPSIAAAYGMRRLRTAYTGNILRLRRASDDAEADFGYTSTGDLDTAAIATWLTATTGYVMTWYDQSGNTRNATQATAGAQPLYVASGQNGKPVARFDGANDILRAGSVPIAQPLTVLLVAKYDNADASNRQIVGNHVPAQPAIYTETGNWKFFAGSTVDTLVTDDAFWHVWSVIFNGTSSAWRIDGGAGVTGNPGTNGVNTINVGGDISASFWDGDASEIVMANAAWSDAQRQAAESAANAYWSVY
jgi:hypothetical protein